MCDADGCAPLRRRGKPPTAVLRWGGVLSPNPSLQWYYALRVALTVAAAAMRQGQGLMPFGCGVCRSPLACSTSIPDSPLACSTSIPDSPLACSTSIPDQILPESFPESFPEYSPDPTRSHQISPNPWFGGAGRPRRRGKMYNGSPKHTEILMFSASRLRPAHPLVKN